MLKVCVNCSELKRCKDTSWSLVFFIIGMISTIAVRVVTVLTHVNTVYGEIAWYVGVLGFFVFFVYKYRIEQARYRLILQHKLMDKVSGGAPLSDDDRKLMSAILCALSSHKDRINYILIFVSSAAAIVVAVYLDFTR